MSKRMKVAVAVVAAVVVAGGGTWSAQGSAPSDGSKHYGWPTSPARSATGTLAQAKASAARSGSRVLTVIEQEDRSAFVDVGETGESAGDYFLFEGTLKSEDGTKAVGRDSGRCTLGIRTFQCEATALIFGKGKITVSGAFFAESDVRISIVGGTGAYKEVDGQLTVDESDPDETLLIFELR